MTLTFVQMTELEKFGEKVPPAAGGEMCHKMSDMRGQFCKNIAEQKECRGRTQGNFVSAATEQ